MTKKQALVILADNFEEIEAITPMDVLDRAGIGVTRAGLSSKKVTGAHGVQIVCDTVVKKIRHTTYDAIVLPGGPGTKHLIENRELLDMVAQHAGRQKLCCAICAAPQVLDAAGVIGSARYTCYPGIEERISSGTHTTDPVVHDGILITSRGPATALAFSLSIVETLCDVETSSSLAKALLYTP
ncbi:DJ-1 family glyoxalase III [Chitinivibrio alkaliphilus]|uniref:DJ-1 family protein n=1 Tax=Chitinivibrio alkaliphilus ACht1 TaxID=1313304 RepID=U7D6I5_9BACT|nr:DJ-1 family glyoxalase III [Chitinivibrio alkaliphilus]ERP32129.1 DJ-1 family protein [Chitinivibrio alkaliphilus ACht1]